MGLYIFKFYIYVYINGQTKEPASMGLYVTYVYNCKRYWVSNECVIQLET